MLDGEMKNSRELWKVRDTENGERRMACQETKILRSFACEEKKRQE